MKKPARRLAHQKTGSGLIPESLRSGLGRPAGCASELLPDACGLSFTFAQLEQLGTANPAATLYLAGVDQRAVRLENALHARSVRDFDDSDCRVDATVALGNANALSGLPALAQALAPSQVDPNGIACCKSGSFALSLLFVDFVDDIARGRSFLVSPQFPIPGLPSRAL